MANKQVNYYKNLPCYISYMVIDLSVPINEKTPVYPGDPQTKIEAASFLERDGYTDHYISIGTHVGTHIDAPLHMLANAKSLDQLSIDHFISPGRCISVEKDNFSLETVASAGVQAEDIVLFHTGMSSKYYDPAYFHEYPAIPEDVAHYLVKQKLKWSALICVALTMNPLTSIKFY